MVARESTQRLAMIVVAAALISSPVRSAAPTETAALGGAETQQAFWAAKERHFVYQGFTTKYSCEGLAAQVRKALLELGARSDLKVREGVCTRLGEGPEPFPNVDVTMQVLELPSSTTAERTTLVPAHWKTVDVRLDSDPMTEAGDCELLEQIKQSFLPLFTTRHVDYHSSCTPHQLQLNGTWLKAELLLADPTDAKALRAPQPKK